MKCCDPYFLNLPDHMDYLGYKADCKRRAAEGNTKQALRLHVNPHLTATFISHRPDSGIVIYIRKKYTTVKMYGMCFPQGPTSAPIHTRKNNIISKKSLHILHTMIDHCLSQVHGDHLLITKLGRMGHFFGQYQPQKSY